MPTKKLSSANSVSVPFEWEAIDDIYVPVIFREKEKYLAVRIAELKLLTRFPNALPDELKSVEKCASCFITAKETFVLDKINRGVCRGEYGREPFTTNDLILAFEEFREFYELVNDTVICKNALELGLTDGGWVQINNTVCPYVWLDRVRYLPVEVACLAADFHDEGDPIATVTANESQLSTLNELCEKANASFAFDDGSTLVSMLILKKSLKLVVMEIPPDEPFTHAAYVDLECDVSVHQCKVKAKQAMNVFYNAAIVKRFNKGAAADPTASSVHLPMEEDLTTGHLTSCHSPDLSNRDECKSSTSVESSSANDQQPPEEDSRLPGDTTEDAAEKTIEKHITERTTPPPLATLLADEQRSDNHDRTKAGDKTNRETPRGGSSHSIEDELMIAEVLTVDTKLMIKISVMDPALKAFARSLKPGTCIDMSIVRFICRCIRIYMKVRKILVLAKKMLQSSSGSADKHGCCAQAIVLLDDAIHKDEFWRASSHKISIGIAALVNLTLLKVVCGDNAVSFFNSPDISHFLVAGMFGARTPSAATNFRFLQMVFTAGCVASGRSPVHPFQAYNFVSHNYVNSSHFLCQWWHKLPAKPHKITQEIFVTNLYMSYDEVYRSPTQQRPLQQQLDLETSANKQISTSADTHHASVNPPPVMRQTWAPLSNQPLMSQVFTGSVYVPRTPFQQPAYPVPMQSHQSSQMTAHGHGAPRMSAVVQGQTGLHTKAVQHRQIYPKVHGQPVVSPAHASRSLILPPYSRPYTQAVSESNQEPYLTNLSQLGDKDKQHAGFKPARVAPYPTPVTRVQQVPRTAPSDHDILSTLSQACISVGSSVAPVIACPELITTSSYELMRQSSHVQALPQVTVSQTHSPIPSQSAIALHVKSSATASSQPGDNSVEDLADHIVLTRAHGKKIAVFEGGAHRWALAEDVQRIFFPRMSMDEFLQDMLKNKVLLDLSLMVAQAFRCYYDMSDDEKFEADKMLTVDSLSLVVPRK